jgi:hypothetical protein
MEQAFGDLLAYGGAILGSLVLGFVKGPLGKADSAIVNLIKPVQPLIVGIAALGVPYLATALGLHGPVDPSVFVAAPTATVLTITAREVLARLKK